MGLKIELEGWKFEEKVRPRPFKTIEITAPNGYTAVVNSHDFNPSNVLYLLAKEVINQQSKQQK